MKTDNELIAEFMGVTVWRNWGEYLDATYYKMHHGKPTNDSPLTDVQIADNKVIESKNVYAPLRYDTSWDWLMPVVEKINEIKVEQSNGLGFEFDVTIQHQFCSIGCRTRPTGVRAPSTICKTDDVSINAVYSAVVEFIKWYNEQVKGPAPPR